MKIQTKRKAYEEVMALPRPVSQNPVKQWLILRWLLKTLSAGELKKVHFHCTESGMEKLPAGKPCLILMNHSSFLDLKIASTVLYPRPFHIVCTADGFVGKDWLMRRIGCIPTYKFITDLLLVKHMLYALKELKSSVLMFPEASYSFDGTATPLPESLGKCIKLLKAPVVMIQNRGGYLYDPLYNGLQLRDVQVTAEMKALLTEEEVREKSAGEINEILRKEFSFDHFRWQQEHRIRVTEGFRADHLNRVLYKCPHCMTEGQMEGKGTRLICHACRKEYELTEDGFMRALEGETEIPHIPDWYRWERSCVAKELEEGSYRLDVPVDIRVMVDTKCIYEVGEGRLVHTKDGFHLTGCDGKLDYRQKPQNSYSLYADYYWYEIGDMICIGDSKVQYYCFPKDGADVVAKARLATEELYRMTVGSSSKNKNRKGKVYE